MSVMLQNSVGGSGRSGAAPVPGNLPKLDGGASNEAEGSDFASVLKDVPFARKQAANADASKKRAKAAGDGDAVAPARKGPVEKAVNVDEIQQKQTIDGHSSKEIKEKKKPAGKPAERHDVDDVSVAVANVVAVAAVPAAGNPDAKPAVDGIAATSASQATSGKVEARSAAETAAGGNVGSNGDEAAQDAPNADIVAKPATDAGGEPSRDPAVAEARPKVAKAASKSDGSAAVPEQDHAPVGETEATELLSLIKERSPAPSRAKVEETAQRERGGTPDSAAAAKAGDRAVSDQRLAAVPQGNMFGVQIAAERAPAHAAVVTRIKFAVEGDGRGKDEPAAIKAFSLTQPEPMAKALSDDQNTEPMPDLKMTVSVADAQGDKGDASAPKADGIRPVIAPGTAVGVSQPSTPLTTPPVTGFGLAGALSQQVVDLGVSGQWIEDIAQQIASIGANPGHGRFKIASANLGAVQVEITPGAFGSDILMTADSDAAQSVLARESDRLVHDARLASVRIGDVRVERGIVAPDAARGDMNGNGHNGGHTPSGHQSGLAQNGQQNGGQRGQADPSTASGQGQGQNSPKTPFTKSVLDHAALGHGEARRTRSDTARYA
ncbi:MAG: hypothetical protein R3E04_12610 [Sphingobium sp.]